MTRYSRYRDPAACAGCENGIDYLCDDCETARESALDLMAQGDPIDLPIVEFADGTVGYLRIDVAAEIDHLIEDYTRRIAETGEQVAA
ncbi:MAG: hypothetical protein HZY73_11125 [Micropruina sp.]|nr:MAG: hypothetical protein HZY73_11125 [Micropruina sp.]